MQITASAVSLNVADVPASAAFLTSHFGFRQEMAADGFASLARKDAGMNVVFLRRGLPLLPENQRDTHASGLILAFVVEDLEGELARLREEGVDITMPLREEPWGERAFQVTDPNGVIVQLLDWNAPAGSVTERPGRRITRRPGREPGHGRAPRARRPPAIPHRTWRHVVTKRTTRRWPGLKHIRRPRTRRGWLTAIAASGAILALKLTLGLGVLALAVHLLTH